MECYGELGGLILKVVIFIICVIPSHKKSFAQIITTFAGTGSSVWSGDNGPAIAAGVPNPAEGDIDKYGNFYFADAAANRISKIDTLGIITTVAGNGHGGFNSDDIQATASQLDEPVDVKLDTNGNLFIADVGNNRIRKVDAVTGIITTVAGTGADVYNGDTIPATNANLWAPEAVCLDKFGNLYISDVFHYRIRKVSPSGIITTYAGNGTGGYSGDSTIADTAKLGFVGGLCSDRVGNIYLADNSSEHVFKIYTSGIMVIVAGNGTNTYSGDGIPATASSIDVIDVTIDTFNNLYIADKLNTRAYKVDAATSILYNVAGNGVHANSGDGGIATGASLYNPISVILDACGNLYISTIGNGGTIDGRIRKVTFDTACDAYHGTLQVNSVTVNSVVSIFPNPATNEITITAKNKISSITVTNLIGQTVYMEQENSVKAAVYISTFPPGMYMIAVTDEEGNKVVKKIVKE